MLSRCLMIGLGLSTLGGCTKGTPTEDQSPAATRAQECDRFAKDMAFQVSLAGQVLVTALDDDPKSAKSGRSEMKTEAQRLRDDLRAKCLTWPEEVMRCLPPLGSLKEGCEERLIAALDGATAPPKDVPAGPAPVWTFTLESEPRFSGVADDGTVVTITGVESNELVGLREGAVVWRTEGDHASWLLPLPGTPVTWLAAEENRILAFDPSTGHERWSAALPALSEEEGGETPAVMVAALAGAEVLVGDAQARFFTVNPARCGTIDTAGAGECVTPQGRLADEFLESDARLFVDAAGKRYLREDDELRAFAPDWRELMIVQAHDSLGHVALREGRLVLVVDDDVVDLDPTQCRGATPIGVSGWPQPGVLTIGDSECEECGPPPPGCRRWRVYLEGATGNGPALLDDGTVVIHSDEHTYAVHDGSARWKIALGGDGPLITDGTRVFGYSNGRREDDPPVVFELDPATGIPRWQTPLPRDNDDYIYGDDVRLTLAGARLMIGYQQTLVMLTVPPGA